MVSSDVSVSTKASTSSAGSGPSAPRPMPMAIMRNAHEAIRGAMDDIQALLDQDDFESARVLWHKFHRFSDLHMKMEEGRKGCNARGLFQLVDDYADGAVEKGGLRHHHESLYELEEDVVDVFEKAPDIKRAKEVYPLFREENEAHLKEEENILMPAIKKMLKKKMPVKKYLLSDVLPTLTAEEGDLEFFIRFANDMLQKHDPMNTRVRVFDHGLWALASGEEQWEEWNSWIQDTLTDDKYQQLAKAIEDYKEEQRAKNAPPVKTIEPKVPKQRKSFFQKIFSMA